jgi:CMP-N-acetylneuraminic acid synthetase
VKIFIPIKKNSQRVEGKNFRIFDGLPLYKHTLYKLKDFDVFVDTDSDEILEEVSKDRRLFHVSAYRRSPDLIGDETPVCDLIKYFAETHCDSKDAICQVHVTSPFLSVKTLKEAHNIINNDKRYDSVVSCSVLQTRLWRQENYGMCPINHNPMKLEQTQDLPRYYEENSLFYIFYSGQITATGNRIGTSPYFYVTEQSESLDIDTEEDWQLANIMVKK